MSSLKSLINKSKEKKEVTKTGFSLKVKIKESAPKSIPESKPLTDPILDSKEEKKEIDPFKSLSDALAGTKLSLDKEVPTLTKKVDAQFKSPTLTDLSKFIFEEQIESYSEDTIQTFCNILVNLEEATGDQISVNLAKCLNFLSEHDFLAPILKPESDAILVNAMRKSYGFIVNVKTEKAKKKVKQNEKVNAALDALSNVSF